MTYKTKEWPDGLSKPEVSKRLSALRKVFGHSHNYISDYCGISQSTYSKYENGQLNITTRSAAHLACLYGVDLDFILLGKSDQVPTSLSLKLGLIRERI